MAKNLAMLLIAIAAERFCERIRPTRHYCWTARVRMNNGPWEDRCGSAGQRLPWQSSYMPPRDPHLLLGEVEDGGEMTVQGWTVREGNG